MAFIGKPQTDLLPPEQMIAYMQHRKKEIAKVIKQMKANFIDDIEIKFDKLLKMIETSPTTSIENSKKERKQKRKKINNNGK